MNLIIGAPWWLAALLFLALAAAAAEDMARLKISNWTCLAVIVLAIVAVITHGWSNSLWQNALIFVAILAIGTPIFSAGLLGGGDVKLLAAIALWFDLRANVGFLVATVLAGGVVAILFIIGRKLFERKPVDKRVGKMPYGLAIVAGAAFMLVVQLNVRPQNSIIEQMRQLQTAKESAG